MYKTYGMLFTLLNIVSYTISSNSVFPPIGNVYKASVRMPFAGEQYVEYKRFEEKKSYIYLSGPINYNCTININDVLVGPKTKYIFSFDNDIIEKLKRIRCSITNPEYNMIEDVITFKIYLDLIKYNKKVVLRNY